MDYRNWQIKHRQVIHDFLLFLNSQSNEYILKGGTSLLMCYQLDRFSEDIDLDCVRSKKIEDIIKSFCAKNGYTYRLAKDTDTVKRFYIDYGGDIKGNIKKLKIEISYRRQRIDPSDITKINGINVYNIENIAIMKAGAYSGRDKIRDLYDVTFIINNYWDDLSHSAQMVLRNCVENKGIEQFDYLIETQSDELISNDKLAADFLRAIDTLGLLLDDEEKNIRLDNFAGYDDDYDDR